MEKHHNLLLAVVVACLVSSGAGWRDPWHTNPGRDLLQADVPIANVTAANVTYICGDGSAARTGSNRPATLACHERSFSDLRCATPECPQTGQGAICIASCCPSGTVGCENPLNISLTQTYTTSPNTTGYLQSPAFATMFVLNGVPVPADYIYALYLQAGPAYCFSEAPTFPANFYNPLVINGTDGNFVAESFSLSHADFCFSCTCSSVTWRFPSRLTLCPTDQLPSLDTYQAFDDCGRQLQVTVAPLDIPPPLPCGRIVRSMSVECNGSIIQNRQVITVTDAACANPATTCDAAFISQGMDDSP